MCACNKLSGDAGAVMSYDYLDKCTSVTFSVACFTMARTLDLMS